MKLLIIRFSSIGDLTQSLSIPSFMHQNQPDAEIHFVTRADLAELVENHPHVQKLWTLDRKTGLKGLWRLIRQLRKENYTHIYDAHNNLRSFLIRLLVPARHKLVRPMMRLKRFLLLQFRVNLFEMPFSGQRDLIKPLEKWGYRFELPPTPQLFLKTSGCVSRFKLPPNYIVLVPSAAYELKRWPLTHWQKLIEARPQLQFVVLAGEKDDFTKSLEVYKNVVNLTGQTSLSESAEIIQNARVTVTNDTGLLHFSEQLGKPTIALMGPAPFGFPSRDQTLILERKLKCRPCSKHGQGPCTNSIYQECLSSITPDEVSAHLERLMKATS